jgi:peptidoglycan/LPS O-acetylase OafA/YrhL
MVDPLQDMTAVADSPQTSNNPCQEKRKYRPEIDGLRAFAVIAVILNHFNKDLLPSGYLGVDIFFVISGYVITSSLSGRESKNFGDFLSGFYERRIKRLIPALVVFVLITSALVCLFNPDPGTVLKTGITSLFGLSNLYLLKQSTDYFAQSTELNPFTHTWSLGVEEQFYMLFPFLVWFSGFGRQAKNGARNLFLWIGSLTVVSLAGFIYLYQTNQPAAYFLMPTRFWEMAAGCLVFIGFQKRAKIEQALEQVPPLLVVAAMVGVMCLPVRVAVLATISIVVLSAILVACLKNGTAAFSVFTNRSIVYIGLISYSLYLWHWGVLSLSRWTIGINQWSAPFQFLLIGVLAVSSYELVEKRFRRAVIKRQIVAIGIGGIAAVITSMLIRLVESEKDSLFLRNLYDVRQSESFAEVKGRPFDPTCVVDGQVRLLSSKTFDNCTIRPTLNGLPTVWALGDSHAGHLSGMLDAMHKRHGIGYHLVETPGIPFPQTSRNIFRDRQVIFDNAAARMKKGDAILLSRLYIDRTSRDIVGDLDRWIGKVSDLARIMNDRGIRVAIMQPTPFFSSDSVSCNSSFLARLNDECRQSKSEYREIFEPVNSRLRAMRAKNKNIVLLDPTKVLCKKGESSYCARNIRRNAIYRDGDHLNSKGSSMLSELIAKTLFGKALGIE